MDENAARQVMLVRAIESTDTARQVLSDDDRTYASQSAQALAQWDASSSKSAVTPALFLHKRAGLILKRIEERTPSFGTLTARKNWLHSLANALPVIALLSGALADRISDPHRVDLLSAPLLLIIGWNGVVYALLLFCWLAAAWSSSSSASRADPAQRGWIARLSSIGAGMPAKLPQPLATAVAAFAVDWLAASAPLTQARIQRAIHFSAAAFALGAVVSLYVRGLLSQYQAGWESTFLDAQQVHTALSMLFLPAMSVFQLPGFSLAQVQALELPQSGAAIAGAQWVHLYAATLLLLVILPRLVLAGAARWKETKLSTDFPIDLRHGYFRKLTQNIGPALPAVLRVFPYSFTVDEGRDKGLNTLAKLLLGERASVMLRPSTGYGQAPAGVPGVGTADNPDVGHTVILFNLNATPEQENHGAFLDHFVQRGVPGFSVLIDESGYLERMGAQAAGAARVRERIALWRDFCAQHKTRATVVNLLHPEARQDELERNLATSALAP